MKKSIYILLLCISFVGFSQKKDLKRFQTKAATVNVFTAGLDNVILENSSNSFIEVVLLAESYDNQLIQVENTNNEANIKFHFEGTETREVVFRKYITKRLQRATVTIKIPKGKAVNVYGENVDITSKSIYNTLAIYIDNGIVKLNSIQKNTTVKLYAGNVYGVSKKSSFKIISNTGKIKINKAYYVKNYSKNTSNKNPKLTIKSIKANVFLTTEK